MIDEAFHPDTMRCVLLEGIHASAVDVFENHGYTHVEQHATAHSGDALTAAIAKAHFIGIRSRTHLTDAVLDKAPHLLAIGCFCIGTNQVDLAAAARRGIPVFNAPFSNTRSVAELVLAEIIMLLRGIPEKNAAQHRGGWMKHATGSHEARGKTLGIVGYGHIGTQIGILAEQLGMRVLYHDIESRLALGNAHPVPTLDTLLAQADVVSLHVPQTPATQNLINAKRLAQMKPGSHLINASRGTVVDIDALAQALASGHLRGAAIDVFPQEPGGNSDSFTSPLTRFDNVLLTPHIGGSTLEAQENIGTEVATHLMRYGQNGSVLMAVNFPELSLPVQHGATRILHIHRNVPGVLAKINDIFSAAGINIAAQYLQTGPELGYAAIDIDAALTAEDLKRLRGIEGTLRCRTLVR
ncbi:MAG: phosphoglycerate dehydrogenase [Denitromonas halophila]|nr:MAG: phosphoglycerate dehydrogenase [Denitromonas halophila]TVT69017.1 MAG: phosphoglycerate dehydrogenase [Denitromonas halophila]